MHTEIYMGIPSLFLNTLLSPLSCDSWQSKIRHNSGELRHQPCKIRHLTFGQSAPSRVWFIWFCMCCSLKIYIDGSIGKFRSWFDATINTKSPSNPYPCWKQPARCGPPRITCLPPTKIGHCQPKCCSRGPWDGDDQPQKWDSWLDNVLAYYIIQIYVKELTG